MVRGIPMPSAKIAISLDGKILHRLDSLIKNGAATSRSALIRDAIEEKLRQLGRERLASECAKLDRGSEQALAEDRFGEDPLW